MSVKYSYQPHAFGRPQFVVLRHGILKQVVCCVAEEQHARFLVETLTALDVECARAEREDYP
jgi:hypothetical protein